MRVTTILVLFVAILLGIPSAAQAWGAKGSNEPDTTFDSTHGWMYTGTDTTACADPTCATGPNLVYFNGFLGQPLTYEGISFNSGTNPNLATLGTGIPTFPDSPKALLGIWKDCNADGYVGLGDNALLEYREEILKDSTLTGGPGESICPVGTIPSTIPHTWLPIHNDGTWIHEYIPLGEENRQNPSTTPDPDPWNLADQASRVWVDDGVPGGPPSGTCYTLAYPPGSFHTVGGMIDVADCYLTDRVGDAGTNATCAANDCSAWDTVRAVKNPWGEENGGSDATVWDCSQAPIVAAPDEGNVYLAVNHPMVPPSVDTSLSGSPGGTANATLAGLSYDPTPAQGGGKTSGDGTCKSYYDANATSPGQTVADVPYHYEAAVNPVVGVKIAPDWTLRFTEDTARPAPVVGSSLGRGSPGDGGTGQDVYGRGYWATPSVRAISRNPFVDRTLIAPQSVTVDSYYAYVSPTAISTYHLSLPKSAYGSQLVTGTYGAEACGSFTSGVHEAWQCDPNQWYANGKAGCTSNLENIEYCSAPGDPYDLLDVDCYDFSATPLRDQGVSYGVLTGTSCP